MKQFKKYKKLCKSSVDLIGKRSRLLFVDDHILQCNKIAGSEEYRRFFFKDLQSITVFRTLSGFISNIILSIVIIFFISLGMLVYFFAGSDVFFGVGIFFGIITLIVFIALIINLIKGSTSKTIITTLNSQDTLVLSGRFYKTKKVIDSLREYIVKEQGEFSQKDIVNKLQEGNSTELQSEEIDESLSEPEIETLQPLKLPDE